MKAESNLGGLISLSSSLLSHHLDKQFASANLPINRGQWVLLFELSHIENKTPAALADSMFKQLDVVTQLSKELDKLGYIRKNYDPNDRRRYFLDMTPEGKEVMEQGKKIGFSALAQAVHGFSDQDKALLGKLLHNVVVNLR